MKYTLTRAGIVTVLVVGWTMLAVAFLNLMGFFGILLSCILILPFFLIFELLDDLIDDWEDADREKKRYQRKYYFDEPQVPKKSIEVNVTFKFPEEKVEKKKKTFKIKLPSLPKRNKKSNTNDLAPQEREYHGRAGDINTQKLD